MQLPHIDLIQQYQQYLGISFDVYLHYEACGDLFAKSGVCVYLNLFLHINCIVCVWKYINKNFNYDIFTHLFKTYIAPVILYGSEACGYNVFKNVIEFNIEPCVSF